MTLLNARLAVAHLIGSCHENAARPIGEDGGPPEFSLGDPGHCSGDPALTITVFDDSGSLGGPGGTDPVSRRYNEALVAFRHIASACDCGKEFGAVIHFDCPTPRDVRPVRLGGHGLRQIRRGLRPPPGPGSSDLGPALAKAQVVADRFQGDVVNLVVFSDFLLTDHNPVNALDKLAGFPGAVHAVVLSASPPRQLTADPAVAVTTIDASKPSGAVGQALFASLVGHRLGRAAHSARDAP